MDATATRSGSIADPAGTMTGTTSAVPGVRPIARIGALPCVWGLPRRPESAGTARRLARTALDEWGVDGGPADQILLVVSELVTNAVEHAQPPVALHLHRPTPGGTLRVEVDDGGPATHEGAWAASCRPEECGRGTSIIDSLATTHGTRTLPHGTTHWADLPIAA
ncbi:ATP-binding protein (plasmid) [Kitasatospora sp. NBC_00070]